MAAGGPLTMTMDLRWAPGGRPTSNEYSLDWSMVRRLAIGGPPVLATDGPSSCHRTFLSGGPSAMAVDGPSMWPVAGRRRAAEILLTGIIEGSELYTRTSHSTL